MKRIQPKTMLVITKILEKRIFSQRMIWRDCNDITKISIGHVNRVFKDLMKNGFVKKRSKLAIKYGLDIPDVKNTTDTGNRSPIYYLNDPIGLLKYISYLRSMNDLLIFETKINASRENIMEKFGKMGVIFCLGSSIERYSAYFKPDDVSFYSLEPDIVQDILATSASGDTYIRCYEPDHLRSINKEDLGKLFVPDQYGSFSTGEVQTVIDMFCDGKGTYTKTILEKIWGVHI